MPERHQIVEGRGLGEVVLVVDDEPTIRMLVAEVLESGGFAGIEAADGPSGLRILESNTSRRSVHMRTRTVVGAATTIAIAAVALAFTPATSALAPEPPETVMVTYHAKGGAADELARVITDHWSTAKRLGLVIRSTPRSNAMPPRRGGDGS